MGFCARLIDKSIISNKGIDYYDPAMEIFCTFITARKIFLILWLCRKSVVLISLFRIDMLDEIKRLVLNFEQPFVLM